MEHTHFLKMIARHSPTQEQWADPGVLWKKAPRAMRAMRGKALENRTISTVLWVHKKPPQSTVKLVLPSNESYESKTGCNRTPATVLWVPLKQPWEPVDPVVADPVRQDNDKRNNIQIYIYIYGNSLLKYTEGGDKTSQYSYLVVGFRPPPSPFWQLTRTMV